MILEIMFVRVRDTSVNSIYFLRTNSPGFGQPQAIAYNFLERVRQVSVSSNESLVTSQGIFSFAIFDFKLEKLQM